jgi:hypothetical protein
MKAALVFTLPEENQEHLDAIHGTDWRLAHDQATQQVRNWMKYGHTFKTPEEALEAVRKELVDAADFGP